MITAESFGADCPDNWEKIASDLNEMIKQREIENDRDAIDNLWEEYFRNGGYDAENHS